jgi:Zn-dependent oligopeptidase
MPVMPEHAPPFDYASVTTEAIARGCDAAIERCDAILEGIAGVEGARTFANTLAPLDEVTDTLSTASGRYGFLTYVSADEAIRETALEYEQKLDTYATGVGFREDLYGALSAFAETEEAVGLEGEAARLLEFSLRDFRRNGFELGPDERARVQRLKERLVTLGVEFRRNIDEYEDGLWLRREQLAGLPASYVDRLETEEVEDGLRYRVSLEYPEMYPFMEAAEDGELRHELFRKNHNKAADVNLPLLAEAIAVRDEIAEILRYDSWAEYQLEVKMARTPSAVQDFLVDLQAKVQVKADQDIEQLTESKRQESGDADARLELWDWRYQMQRVLREEYDVDQFAVAEYFPLEATLDGLFDVYQRLVGVRFVAIEAAQAWHEDVRLYAIEDASSGEQIAHFYMDLHPRPDKYGHAAAFSLRMGRELPDGSFQTPVSSIVANFTKPTAGSPSLLRHSEVETLFHEFGHILHQTMTRARFARFSGTRVERDFVEAPSQMLEHWVWDAEVLAGFTCHVETGDPLPADLLDRMLAAKNVASGVHYLRQLYFARLDLAYHLAGREKDTDAIAEELHDVTGFPFEPDTHFQAGFGHLFGYDAGYYGYLWSQVFGDDMFSRFEADGETAGADYRRLILERGGSVDGGQMLREFLGRDPQPEAFLRGIGLQVG